MGNCSSDSGAKKPPMKAAKETRSSARMGGYGSESLRGSLKARAPVKSNSTNNSSTNNSPAAVPAAKPEPMAKPVASPKGSNRMQDTMRSRSAKSTLRSGEGIVIDNNGTKRVITAAARRENEFNRYATALLQKEESYEEWSTDKWPWPWLMVDPPHPKKSSQADYVLFLKCFRILESSEVDAYQSWKKDDPENARQLLASASDDKLERTVTEEVPTAVDDTTDSPKLNHAIPRHQEIHNIRNVKVSDYEAEVYPKTEAEASLLVRTLRSSPLFGHVVRDTVLLKVAGCMKKRIVPPNTMLFKRGEIPSQPYFYVAVAGDVLIDGIKQRTCCAFGDFAVTSTLAKSEQTITTGEDSVTVFLLENDVFNGVMGRLSHEKREQYKKWLKDIHFLSTQTPSAILQLADALQEKKYTPGEVIVEFDQLGDYMHFIVEGTVDVIGRESSEDGVLLPDKKRWVCDFKAGHPIGYCEFFEPQPSRNIADCVAKDTVITARINRQHFEACMGPVKDLLEQLTEAPEYAYYRCVFFINSFINKKKTIKKKKKKKKQGDKRKATGP